MPTIKRIKRKKGGNAFQIGFYRQGERRWLSLPSFFTRADAAEIAANVARIIEAEKAGRELDARTAAWVRYAPRVILRKLEALELIDAPGTTALGELVDQYERAEILHLKASTLRTKHANLSRLTAYFPNNKEIGDFSEKDAATFAASLSDVAAATRATVLRDCKRLFNWAKERGDVDSNPFESVTVGNFKNKARERYVTADEYRALLTACETRTERALLALFRIGGLRLSEGLAMEWQDVDLKARTMCVRSPKTAHFKGKESRAVPLFAELYEELVELWKEQGGAGRLFTWSADQARGVFYRIRKRAGVEPYPRPFQNMRSSRAIEIARDFGAVAESAWLGHSNAVALDHYLHVVDSDFQNATTKTTTI